MVDLVISPEERQIVDSVADFLAAEVPVARLRPGAPRARPDDALWRAMGELGWFMLALPEERGGLGMSAVEEALVFVQLGRHLLSPNVLASALGARVAAAAGADELAQAIAAGRHRVALAVALAPPQVGATVSGRFHIFDRDGASSLLVVGEDGHAALLDVGALQGMRRAASAVDGMTIDQAELRAVAARHAAGPEHGLHVRLRLLSAAMLAGICEATRDLAADYAKLRTQFGQPIGAFQAIKHKCADMAVRAEAVGRQVDFAAVTLASGREDALFQGTAAKLLAGQYALLNAKETIQVHGGIGFTVECDAHHYLKRAHVFDHIGGATRRQQQLMLALAAPASEVAA